jgi:aminomethyltransferase
LGVGYVLFNAPGDWVGRALSLRLPNGTMHNSQAVEVPFFDREKKIARGIDRRIPVRPEI